MSKAPFGRRPVQNSPYPPLDPEPTGRVIPFVFAAIAGALTVAFMWVFVALNMPDDKPKPIAKYTGLSLYVKPGGYCPTDPFMMQITRTDYDYCLHDFCFRADWMVDYANR